MADVFGCSTDDEVVEQNDAVLDDSYGRSYLICAILVEDRSAINDVINVPFARFSHCIGKWNHLLVNAACLAVAVCFVFVAVENLYLIFILKENAAVATSLARACDVLRYTPFDMQLETAEFLLCQNISLALVYSEDTVVNVPFCFAAFRASPCVQILSVEEHDGI